MKEKLTKNLGVKLLSLVLASIMWIVIVNLDDPMITREFKGIEVEILNQDDIQSLDKVYDIVEGGTVDITVRGKRSNIDRLKSTDIKATADLANRYIADPNAKTLNVHIDAICTKYTSTTVDVRITGTAQVLKISLEDIDTKQFKVTVQQDGALEDGYAIGSITAKPNMVEVSGAKSQISKISEVRVYMDVNGMSEDTKAKLIPRVFDENGTEIDSSKMKFSIPEITVTVKLLNTKTIPVFIEVTGEPVYGYQYVDKDYEPKQLVVAADQATLDTVESITIPVDITGAAADVEQDIDLAEYLPKDVTVAEDTKTITIKVTIEKLITKEFVLTTKDIQLKNLAEGMKFNYATNADKFIVKVMGLEEEIGALTKDTLGAYIDLTNLTDGKHTMTIQIDLGDTVEVMLSPTVVIELTTNNGSDGNVEATPAPDSTTLPEATVSPSPEPNVE
jgi:YbbR domain-containing protein